MKKINKKGFTLIEVVLVLAIGGLIFLLAFLAFQNASTNRRDTQRRSDAGTVIAELANAEADGFNLTSQNLATFNSNYLDGIEGPGGDSYTLHWGIPATGPSANTENMYIGDNSVCNSNTGFTQSNGNIAVIVSLEKGSACRDDQ